MNPLASLAQILTIKEKSPLPVHFSYIEPMLHPLPVEVAKKYFKDDEQELLTSYVGLENFSTKVLKNIRIKLQSPLGFSPKVESNERGGNLEFTFDKEKLEITIDRIDPNESIYIHLFPSPSLLVKDFEPKVIIDDELLTRGMMRMGYYKKYPSFMFMNIGLLIIALLTISSVFFGTNIFKYLRSLDPDYVLIQESQNRLQSYSCVNTVVKMNSEFDWYFSKSLMPLDYTLKANGVGTYDELLSKEQVVVCLSQSVNKQIN
ncbi:hypothetical protein [Shewanella sp. AC91-MNA-CIBAN-0169]|uniref:hypothetical protein n=1 Tax=Shewanella sp. AC91-MNA-CIBAN-0169 TaxID=3140466 RepID=UPI00332AE375